MRPSCSIDGCDKRRDRGGLCRKHWGRLERHGDPLCPPMVGVHLPVGPLQQMVEQRPGSPTGVLGVNGACSYHRAVRVGWVSVEMADRFAVAFGHHPAELWGDEWWGGLVGVA